MFKGPYNKLFIFLNLLFIMQEQSLFSRNPYRKQSPLSIEELTKEIKSKLDEGKCIEVSVEFEFSFSKGTNRGIDFTRRYRALGKILLVHGYYDQGEELKKESDSEVFENLFYLFGEGYSYKKRDSGRFILFPKGIESETNINKERIGSREGEERYALAKDLHDQIIKDGLNPRDCWIKIREIYKLNGETLKTKSEVLNKFETDLRKAKFRTTPESKW